jgi:hypothetical protein
LVIIIGIGGTCFKEDLLSIMCRTFGIANIFVGTKAKNLIIYKCGISAGKLIKEILNNKGGILTKRGVFS